MMNQHPSAAGPFDRIPEHISESEALPLILHLQKEKKALDLSADALRVPIIIILYQRLLLS